MSQSDPYIVFVNVESEEEAARIGQTVVGEKLAACVNIGPTIRSIYRWQGKIEDESEVRIILKTTRARLDDLTDRIQALHTYDVPCIVGIPIAHGYEPYLDWIRDNT